MITGNTYQVKITEIRKVEKQVPCQRLGGMCQRFDVKFIDRNGNIGEAETLTPDREDSGFVLNCYQEVICMFVTSLETYTIDPTEDPTGARPAATRRVSPLPIQQLQQSNTQQKQPDIDPIPPGVNQYSANFTGKGYTFSMSWAKELMVAEISKQPEGYRVTDEDLDRMFYIAHKINDDIYTKLNF